MKKPFISVVIPTWRENKVLSRCLDSLLAQDYPRNKFEIVIVSEENIKTKSKKTRQIKAPKGTNHAEARNIGVSKTKGEIIAFCDDDCVLPKNWLKRASSYFIKKGADLIGGPVIPPTQSPFPYRLGGYLMGSPLSSGFAAAKFQKIYPEKKANEPDLILANTFIKKKVFTKLGKFHQDQVPCEENFLYAKAKRAGYKLFYVPKIACSHPAKPIFFPLAKKVFFYGTGRGLMIARAPTFFHPQYFIPSLFVFTLLGLLIFAPFVPQLRFFLWSFIFIYLMSNFINAFYIFFRFEKNFLFFIAAPLATFLIHVYYGLGVVYGLGRYSIGQKGPVAMPSKY